MAAKKRLIKQINVDVDKCIGCRACELACAAFHAVPKYSSVNPARSRIRVMVDDLNDVYVPVRGTDYTPAECNGRYTYQINGKMYKECGFCGCACSTRDRFKDPDSGLPLICDMCLSDPPLEEPWCVKVCGCGALTYVEREEETIEEQTNRKEIEFSLDALADKFDMQRIIDTVVRMSKKT